MWDLEQLGCKRVERRQPSGEARSPKPPRGRRVLRSEVVEEAESVQQFLAEARDGVQHGCLRVGGGWSGLRGSNPRRRLGRPQPDHSAKPALPVTRVRHRVRPRSWPYVRRVQSDRPTVKSSFGGSWLLIRVWPTYCWSALDQRSDCRSGAAARPLGVHSCRSFPAVRWASRPSALQRPGVGLDHHHRSGPGLIPAPPFSQPFRAHRSALGRGSTPSSVSFHAAASMMVPSFQRLGHRIAEGAAAASCIRGFHPSVGCCCASIPITPDAAT